MRLQQGQHNSGVQVGNPKSETEMVHEKLAEMLH